MHYWGDDWFQKNGKDLNEAINFIEKHLHKHGIGVCGKEKYGTYRDEYLRFWDGGLYTVIFGHRGWIGSCRRYQWDWLKKFVDKFHQFLYYTIDLGQIEPWKITETYDEYIKRVENRKWKGLCHYSQKIGLTNLVTKYQEKHYNKAFQLACKKWPNIKDELIVMVDGYALIKPCKWGDVDGAEIHKKYWKTSL